MRRLLWTGENSIRIRDETAQVLAKQLSAEHAEHPQATQLVIAHSHGGNMALRALHHLKQRDASQLSGADKSNPLVVTLATPFIEVHQADFGRRSHHIRNALITAIVALPIFLPLLFILRSAGDASAVNSSPSYWSGLIIGIVVSVFIAGPLRRWWHSGRVVTR
jgi:hypothetical protein